MITNLTNWLASRPRKSQPTTIVLHATDGASAGSSISWLRKIGLSYHYVIERDGEITKCVPVSRVAFHAGKSFGPSGNNVNNHSVGISFANFESRKEPITDAQVKACGALVKDLTLGVPSLRFLTTHYAISSGRKTDPKMLHKLDILDMAKSANLQVWGLEMKYLAASGQLAFTMLVEHPAIKAFLAGVIAALYWAFPVTASTTNLAISVSVLILLDTLTGIMGAVRLGEPITSHKMGRVAMKFVAYGATLFASSIAMNSIPSLLPIREGAAIFALSWLAATEALSVFENTEKMGVKLPRRLISYLKGTIKDAINEPEKS